MLPPFFGIKVTFEHFHEDENPPDEYDFLNNRRSGLMRELALFLTTIAGIASGL